MSDMNQEKNKMSLFSAVLLCCTCMVGSGWLFASQLAARNAGNYSFIAWIAAAAMIIGIGLCFAVVVTQFPQRGATTRVSAISHNSIFGMPFAFANWFGISVVIATEAQATTQYLAPFMGDSLMQDGILTFTGKSLAMAILFGYLLINWYGIKLLTRINNVVTVFKIFTPLFVIAVLLVSHIDTTNFTIATNSSYSAKDIFPAIVASGMIYAFNGFQVVTAFASEIKNPKRNIPLAIIISVLVVLCFYLLLQFTFMGAMPSEMLNNGGWVGVNLDSPIVGLTILLGLNFLMVLLVADSIVAPSAVGYTYLGMSSRMLYAMSKEKQAPAFLSKSIHPKRGFSVPAMAVNFIIAVVFLLQADSWAGLMIIVTMLHVVGYLAGPVSMAALNPRLKVFGLIVFLGTAALMVTVPYKDFLITNIVLSVLALVFMFTQGRSKLKANIIFGTPFLILLWIVLLAQSLVITLIASAIFFIFVTDKRYVAKCQAFRKMELAEAGAVEVSDAADAAPEAK
jgi:amino acid transporter